MKTRIVLTLLALLAFCGLTSAQSYQIRVTHNTNLRQSSSLDSAIVVTAKAGTVLQVIGSHNRWLKISRAGGDGWMANWVSYTRVEGASGSHGAAPAQNIDNCCFVDRQCDSDSDWTDGYWAFQNGHCQAPTQTGQAGQSPQPSGSAPASQMPAGVDNCCFVDRQCNTDSEWTDGYFAFQNGQCPGAATLPQTLAYTGKIPWTSYMTEGVSRFLADPSSDPFNNCCHMHHNTCHSQEDWERGSSQFQNGQCLRPAPIGTRPAIDNNAKFVYLVENALQRIETHAPEWLRYIYISGLRKFVLLPPGQRGGFNNQIWAHRHSFSEQQLNDPNWLPDYEYIVGFAGSIAHEACHAIKQRTYTQSAGWTNEADCVEAQVEVVAAIDPRHRNVSWLRHLVRNIQNPAYWWW